MHPALLPRTSADRLPARGSSGPLRPGKRRGLFTPVVAAVAPDSLGREGRQGSCCPGAPSANRRLAGRGKRVAFPPDFGGDPPMSTQLRAVMIAIGLMSFGLGSRSVATAGRDGVSLMTFNVLYDAKDVERSLDAIEAADPDVLCLRELSPAFARAFEKRLGRRYPHRSLQPKASGTWGVGIASRLRLSSARVFAQRPHRMPAMEARVATAHGPVVVACLHLFPPVAKRKKSDGLLQSMEKNAELRQQQALAISRRYSAEKRPVVLLGDFNETPGGKAISSLVGSGFQRACEIPAASCGATYPGATSLWPAVFEIDHILGRGYPVHLGPGRSGGRLGPLPGRRLLHRGSVARESSPSVAPSVQVRLPIRWNAPRRTGNGLSPRMVQGWRQLRASRRSLGRRSSSTSPRPARRSTPRGDRLRRRGRSHAGTVTSRSSRRARTPRTVAGGTTSRPAPRTPRTPFRSVERPSLLGPCAFLLSRTGWARGRSKQQATKARTVACHSGTSITGRRMDSRHPRFQHSAKTPTDHASVREGSTGPAHGSPPAHSP